MTRENIVEVTKQGLAQALGSEYEEQIGTLSPTNSAALVDLGTAVTSAQTFEQLFINGVLETMGRLEIEDMIYRDDDFRSMLIDKDKYPGFMARIYFEPSDNIMSDPSFDLQAGQNFAELEHTYFGAKYAEKIFDNQFDLLGAMSYSQEDLITAFRSWEEMGTFLSGKRASILSILDLRLSVWKHMLAQSAIATSINQGSDVKLVTEYKKLVPTFDKTGIDALTDKGDIHCNYSPDKSCFIGDGYPEKDGKRYLYYYDFATEKSRALFGAYSLPLQTDIRCDLHARWSDDGTLISYDTTEDGNRRIAVVPFQSIK